MSEPKTRVLFVCYGNMIRSQIAEGFAREFGDGCIDACSAGLMPTGIVGDDAIAVMAERGIDISEQYSKGLGSIDFSCLDYVVSMTGRPAASFCPASFKGVTIDWDIEDPIGEPIEFYRHVRDEIHTLVRKLVERVRQERGKG